MSTSARQTQPTDLLNPSSQSTYFNQQRALLVNEIAAALDTTLTHLNRLNRSLESIVAVGNEFSSVEALWSQVEGVMGDRDTPSKKEEEEGKGEGNGEQEEEEETEMSM
ncbi:gb [Venturia nashicola]|uniref:DASH complex subunit DAD1 n=1 Tax=Venturia nashicola TaxID=86259 RepID=A0A4Z1PSF2_9PEZI|nr:gb [Venturia nashicola]TLD38114.1 gb [Venturia nashicola]